MPLLRLLPLLFVLVACTSDEDAPMVVQTLSQLEPCDEGSLCVAHADGFSFTLRLGPEIKVLQPFPVSVAVSGAQSVQAITVGFSMRGMDMGLNRYRLIADDNGEWQADVTLPVCVSGRSDWIADFTIDSGEKRYVLALPFSAYK